MRKTNRVGETKVNNEGSIMKIVEYNSSKDIWVEFQDEHKYRKHSNYDNFKKGAIKNPYFISVYGVGYIGEPTRDYSKREIMLWRDMLGRCYSVKRLERCSSYEEATVCERWLCFANFLEDLPLIEGYELWRDNPNQGIALDKDIKGNGTKIYCLEHCSFISNEDNLRERLDRVGYDGNFGAIPIVGIHIKTKEVVEFSSIAEAKRVLGLSNICEVCKGKRKSLGGYVWYYKKDYENMNNN